MNAANPYETSRGGRRTAPAGGGAPWLLFSFEGRICRRQFWIAGIASSVFFLLLLSVVGDLVGNDPSTLIGVTLLLYIPGIWVNLALQIKRWHDRGKSGFWVLIAFVPIVGGIWALIETGFLPGDSGPNQYGPDPT